MNEDCVFCNIINHSMPSTIVKEDDDFIVVKDILPKAPVHLLIIPKKHILSVSHLSDSDVDLVGKMILLGKKVAEEQGIAQSGYKMIFNVGKDGSQVIPHVHLRLLGGKLLPDDL